MSVLFSAGAIGSLSLPNRLVRSATAERMADEHGYPRQQLHELYTQLSEGEVGLIITGHMYVHPSGKAHPEMTGIYEDAQIPALAALVGAVHDHGGLIAAQINHGGMQSDLEAVPDALAPSAIKTDFNDRTAREITLAEIDLIIDAYGQAARRAQAAGFDGVQIHAAHGYLVSEFLSPLTNRRADQWGGDIAGRMQFLRAVTAAVRAQVGPDYPVLIKLGMMDGVLGGLTLAEGVQVVSELADMGIDGVELSGGIGGKLLVNVKKGVRSTAEEAYFIEFARQARPVTALPLLLVGGFRSRSVMEAALTSGDVDFISMCRPLINEPHFPRLLRLGELEQSGCISSNNCWAEESGVGIGCKCPLEKLA